MRHYLHTLLKQWLITCCQFNIPFIHATKQDSHVLYSITAVPHVV